MFFTRRRGSELYFVGIILRQETFKLLIVDVYNTRYTGIKFHSFDSWKTEYIENDRVRISDQSLTTDVTLEIHSLHWHEIEDAVVDYVPAFELYW